MKIKHLLITIVLTSLSAISVKAISAPYNIPAMADIFDAGRAVPIIPNGGAGTLPVPVAFNPAVDSGFQFAYLSGQASQFYSSFLAGPEGITYYNADVYPYDGISGFRANQQFPLVGVFLTDAVPQGTSPATIDFTTAGIGRNFPSLTPEIGQVFYIGDGNTDLGSVQTFHPPVGATRLFLGFADAPNGGGDPGNYHDNEGFLNMQVTTVPEPSTYALLGISFLFVARRLKRLNS